MFWIFVLFFNVIYYEVDYQMEVFLDELNFVASRIWGFLELGV